MIFFTLIREQALFPNPVWMSEIVTFNLLQVFSFPDSNNFPPCTWWPVLCWVLKGDLEDLRFFFARSSLFCAVLRWVPQTFWSHQTLSSTSLFSEPVWLYLGCFFLHHSLGLYIANLGNHGSHSIYFMSLGH